MPQLPPDHPVSIRRREEAALEPKFLPDHGNFTDGLNTTERARRRSLGFLDDPAEISAHLARVFPDRPEADGQFASRDYTPEEVAQMLSELRSAQQAADIEQKSSTLSPPAVVELDNVSVPLNPANRPRGMA
jgi:hypothetical protein